MKKLFKVLFHPGLLAALGLVVLAAVVWYVGPLVAVAEWRPMAPAWVRGLLIVLVVLAVVGRIAWKAWQRRRAERSLAEGIAAPPPVPGQQEVAALDQRFAQAVAVLRSTRQGPFWRRSQTLYELPWYIFIGAPGSGKTTALLNAGLSFPLAAKMGQAAIRGVGGTRNCDWWFTDEAVLIDTAGRYALQQSDAAADGAAWAGFLKLLRRHRPRRPINGVLLTVNVQELLQQSDAERQEHASRLRSRLQELHDALGIRPPVYVLVTKLDLVAGFAETFQDLGKEEREQVFGFSLPLAAAQPGEAPLARFDEEFGLLEQRLLAPLIERMQAERDVLARAALFNFPQQFASLRPLLGDFLRQVFGSGGSLDETPLVRGVYLTSGTQEGTPIDRVLGALARTFGLERRPAPVVPGGGKSFFLHRLLREVVFAEQGLVGVNRKVERRRHALRIAGFAALALGGAALLAGWSISALRNKAYIAEVQARLPGVLQAVEAIPARNTGDIAAVGGVLGQVREVAAPQTFALADPPLLNTLGLYQGDKLDAGARIAYERLLRHALLPRLEARLEERLRAANKANLEQAYVALKCYLMLYTPDHFDPETLKAWIAIDWDAQLRNLTELQRGQLDQHLQALLELGAPPPPGGMDQALVASVRDMLASYPLEYRIYSRLKRRFGNEVPEFSVAAKAGPQAGKVFERASGEPLSRGVPGFYTRAGYAKAFQGGAATQAAAQLSSEEDWVFGRRGSAAGAAGAVLGTQLTDQVRRLYLADYIKTWDAFLLDVRVVPLDGTDRLLEVSQVLASVDSPLANLMRAAAAETTLVPPAKEQNVVDKVLSGADKIKQDLGALVEPGAAPAATGNAPVEKMVDDHFAALRRQVTGQPAPIDEVQKRFADLSAQTLAIKLKAPPPPGGGGAPAILSEAAQLPEPARSALSGVATAVSKQGGDLGRQAITAELKPIFDFCSKAIANRYPFSPSSTADVGADDFGTMFGSGGLLDEFYNRNLAGLVDTGTNPWSYKPQGAGGKPASAAALGAFQNAARIREVFFRQGGKTPGFRIDLRASELADGLKEVTMEIDGKPLKFLPGNVSSYTIAWPGAGVTSQIRLSGQPAAPNSAPLIFNGPWALFRLFENFDVQRGEQSEKFAVVAIIEGKRVRFEVTASSAFNPFRMAEMRQFRCPGAL